MSQFLKNFIPLGDTGSVCYLEDTLKDFDSNNSELIQTRLNELKEKKIQKLILLRSLTKQVNFDSIIPILQLNGFQYSIYTPNSELKKQIELFETIVDTNKGDNVCILYFGISPALFELTIKLVLYVDPNAPIEETFTYLTNETIDIITQNEFKAFLTFLENDPYLITKPDRAEFKKIRTTEVKLNGKMSNTPKEELEPNTAFSLNLDSLKLKLPDNEPLLTETEAIQFNLKSLVETEFQREESPEEHYQNIKTDSSTTVDESLSLDVDLSEEIEYISSLESQIDPTKTKISIINIDTEPLDSPSTKPPRPTIDYKNKEFLDFDAIIEEEIEQGRIAEKLSSDPSNLLSDALDFKDSIEEKEGAFTFDEDLFSDENSSLHFTDLQVETKEEQALPLDDLKEDPVEPSQTFMVKRIDEEIKKEVLNEDSKGKIYVPDSVKINTDKKDTATALPISPKISNPKISIPKFSPITLDD